MQPNVPVRGLVLRNKEYNMKQRSLFLMALAIIGFSSCDKENEITDASISWTIGAEHSQDTTLLLPSSAVNENKLVIVNNSICPSHVIAINVFEQDLVLFRDTIIEQTGSYDLEFDQSQSIHLQTVIIPSNDSMPPDCVWLGQAEFRYDYKQ